MKKLIMTLGLSLAVSSAAKCATTNCPAASDVLAALSGTAADPVISALINSSVSGASSAFVPTTLALVNIPSTTSSNCHYGVGTTNFLTIVPGTTKELR